MRRLAIAPCLIAAMALAAPAQAADFLVTNSFDVGAGSLRQAITDANANPNGAVRDTISFGDLGLAPKITPDTPLPTITESVTIDGYTHPGASPNTKTVGNDAVLKVELSGEDFLGGTPTALTITGGGSTVRGLVINRFDGAAIRLASFGTVIEGNFIGTDVTGTLDLTAIPNVASDGVLMEGSNGNIVGGSTAASRNVISGNGHHGVVVRGGNANLVRGNYIGTTKSGSAALGNDAAGVRVDGDAADIDIGGATGLARNVISSNHEGVSIEGAGTVRTVVRGNYIGLGAGGSGDLGNVGTGVDSFMADDGVVGGTDPGEGNVISGNGSLGVNIRGDFEPVVAATGNVVQGNRIGTNAAGTAAVPNDFDGIQVHTHATNTTIGGLVTRARNVISGNEGNGVFLVHRDNLVQGNYIGTNAAGNAAVPNGDNGILVGSNFNVVGGTVPAARNVVSGNAGNGIEAFAFAEILGNWIGINAAGTDALPNLNGIELGSQAFVGGRGPTPTPGTQGGNVISGNLLAGVLLGDHAGNVEVDGNLIGTDPGGTAAIPNADGIVIQAGASVAAIGFSARNVISGNDFAGVLIRGGGFGHHVLVENHIGLNRAGTGAVPNAVGVEIAAGARDNAIGGATTQKRNVIAGNRFEGIHIHGSGTESNEVVRAFVGLTPGGAALPNARGVVISDGAAFNTVGGSTATRANTISGNRMDGVLITGIETNRNVVRGNLIGTTPGGGAPLPNSVGVNVTAGARLNTVGGPLGQPQSLISGNRNAGVRVADEATLGNRIQGNHIGTAPNGITGRPNGVGVLITAGAQATTIGGTGSLGNRIALNTNSGVLIDGTATDGAELMRNRIFGNGKLAINLRPAGEAADTVTPNDADDPDSGPNALQNFPLISAATGSPGTTTISGTLNSTPNTSFRLDVYRSPASADVEAETVVDVKTVTTNAAGDATWSMSVPSDLSGQVLRATATNLDTRDTSELSATRAVG